MPYGRKKKTMSKRKKTYSKRFKDSKINTKIERKISQIAKKEDLKNRALLVRSTAYGSNTQNYQAGQYTFSSLPPNAAGGDHDFTGLDILNLTAIGGQNYNTPNPKGSNVESNSTIAKYFRITKAQAFLEFLNPSEYPMTVRVSLIYIPNANPYTAAGAPSSGYATVLQPNQWICGVKELRNIGIFRNLITPNSQMPFNFKHTIIKSKQVKLPPARVGAGVNSTFAVNNSNSTPPDQTYHFGYNNTAYSTRKISLSKNWDVNGKRFVYTGQSQANAQEAMSNGNIYIAIAHNAESTQAQPMVKGVAGVQYYIEKPATMSLNN